MITQDEINNAIEKVKLFRHSAYAAASHLGLAKMELDEAKAAALVNGIEGKNAEQRAANLRVMLEDKYNYLSQMQDQYDQEKNEANLAELELTRIQLTIRLMELVKA